MADQNSSTYIKIGDAAQLLGVTHRWVYRRVLSGELPASKVGGLYFISRADLEGLMRSGRVEPQSGAQAPASPQLKCSFCYRLLADSDEIGGECTEPDCSALICQKCWDLRIHTCARHSPTREQRLKNALARAEAGEIAQLVQADAARLSEVNFLNWITMQLDHFPTLIHPLSGNPVNIASWRDIMESGDERAEVMQLLGRVALDSASASQQPLNAWRRFTIRSKKEGALVVHAQAASRVDCMVRDGFDAEPLGLPALSIWAEKLLTFSGRGNEFRLVLLASTTGWDKESEQFVCGDGVMPFSHPQALLYLFDIFTNKLIYNKRDDRTKRYAQLFLPALAGREMGAIITAIMETMGVHDSLTLEEAQRSLPFSAQKIEQAFKQMAEGGEYVLMNLKELGITLVKRQAVA